MPGVKLCRGWNLGALPILTTKCVPGRAEIIRNVAASTVNLETSCQSGQEDEVFYWSGIRFQVPTPRSAGIRTCSPKAEVFVEERSVENTGVFEWRCDRVPSEYIPDAGFASLSLFRITISRVVSGQNLAHWVWQSFVVRVKSF